MAANPRQFKTPDSAEGGTASPADPLPFVGEPEAAARPPGNPTGTGLTGVAGEPAGGTGPDDGPDPDRGADGEDPVVEPAGARGPERFAVAGDPLAALAASCSGGASDGAALSVLFTPSRFEKRAEAACASLEIPVHLPLRAGRASKAGVRAALPLFPGYLFAVLTAGSRRRLVERARIARVIPVSRPELLLTELRQIHRALTVKPDLEAAPALARGRWVRVASGPFFGLTGVIADRRMGQGRLRLVLNLSELGRGVPVEIDAGAVEPATTPAGWRAPDDSRAGRRPRVRRRPWMYEGERPADPA